ncbi:MAG: MBL fold metallo-hydrolase [Candidatus Sungbacteria bacterium]|uniref:MBL fold metallo-hydrolase n=1 Tax=Candidatus Sungiibacteriota bacterium TaxID=2750080 RepID=A0A931WNM9_9BACT|nr:MBL fold metallo-hydrolase [Candidatus Sungbacteria bacterium]
MVISWYGQSCFKIQSGELVVVTDPYRKEIGLTPPRFKAEIVVVTHEHFDHNNVETIPEGAFVVRGPGDYEIKDVAITGISTFHDAKEGKERGRNTVYVIEMEDIRLAHLGDFGEEKIRPETVDAIGEVDILFVPVGGTYTIDAETAAEVVSAIEPKIVIPMHYAIPGLKVKLDGVETFLKEMGVKQLAPEDRLTLKKKDLPETGTTRVVVLKTA